PLSAWIRVLLTAMSDIDFFSCGVDEAQGGFRAGRHVRLPDDEAVVILICFDALDAFVPALGASLAGFSWRQEPLVSATRAAEHFAFDDFARVAPHEARARREHEHMLRGVRREELGAAFRGEESEAQEERNDTELAEHLEAKSQVRFGERERRVASDHVEGPLTI